MTLASKQNNIWTKWSGESINDIHYPLNIEQLWIDADLNALGLFRVVPLTIPPGKLNAGNERLADVNGVPTIICDLVDDINGARLTTFKSDASVADLITKIQSASLAEIDTWLTNNVTNLTQARTVLGILIKFLVTRFG